MDSDEIDEASTQPSEQGIDNDLRGQNSPVWAIPSVHINSTEDTAKPRALRDLREKPGPDRREMKAGGGAGCQGPGVCGGLPAALAQGAPQLGYPAPVRDQGQAAGADGIRRALPAALITASPADTPVSQPSQKSSKTKPEDVRCKICKITFKNEQEILVKHCRMFHSAHIADSRVARSLGPQETQTGLFFKLPSSSPRQSS